MAAPLELMIAPRAVFDGLESRKDKPRFQIPDGTGWRPVTWGAFAAQIRAIALFLSDVGFAHGERAALFAPNRVEWASAALAIQAAGGVMVPVYPASTAEQLAYIASHADARVLFVDTPALLERVLCVWSELACVEHVVGLDPRLDVAKALESAKSKGKTVPSLADAQAKFVSWEAAVARGEDRDAKDPAAFMRTMDAISLEAPGLMLYTSGTSGNPKGVPLTHRNVGVNGRDWHESNASLLTNDEEVDLLWLPMSHIFGLGEMCLGNTLGFTTYLCDPATVLTRLSEVRPTVFMSVPSHWEKIAILAAQGGAEGAATKIPEVTGGRLKFCLSGGAGLKREVKELFHEAGVLIIEGYGLTECSPTLTLNRPDAYRFDTVGKPFPSVELKLAEDGEILAKGLSVFAGYHKDPDATREAFTDDGWFKTGDVGRFTDDGFLQIIDRKKDILVTAGGKNVPPANIELRFRDDQLIAHVVVYGEAQRYLVAGVWLHEGKVLTEETKVLIQKSVDAVNGQLPSYETIKKFVVIDTPLSVEAGLLTSSLKVRRKKVYEAFGPRFEALYREGDTRAGAAP